MDEHILSETHTHGYEGVRRPIDRSRHVPGEIYSSDEIYQLEIELIFKKEWIHVGRVEELAKPGDYLTVEIVGEPIIVTRDRKGDLNAFYNMCAHRGVAVAEGVGNTRAFLCPYHGWVYDLQGKLKGAAGMEKSKDFDASNCRLRPVRVDTWRGNILVCLSNETAPLSDLIAPFEEEFGILQMDRCKIGSKFVVDLECNWKFVHENLMDFYHVNILHAKSFGSNFTWNDDNWRLRPRGGNSMSYEAAPTAPGAKRLYPKMPWLEDKDDAFSVSGYMWPNFSVFGRIDSNRVLVAMPLGPKRCRFTVYSLFPEDFFQLPDIDESFRITEDFLKIIFDEDRSMVGSMQRAMRSPTYVPGSMSVHEVPIQHFLQYYVDQIIERQAASKSTPALATA
ncbi:aromatic ring-hydroxylating oxygenase subunit alpha (plasmid) [Mesorhizobium sp. ORM8.1]